MKISNVGLSMGQMQSSFTAGGNIKSKKENVQINKIRDENGDITIETSEVKTIRTCLKVVYSNTF